MVGFGRRLEDVRKDISPFYFSASGSISRCNPPCSSNHQVAFLYGPTPLGSP
jgi:hypothetical protein